MNFLSFRNAARGTCAGLAIAGILLPLLAVSASGQPATKEWMQGDPTGAEQAAVEAINLIRASPEAAVAYYARLAAANPTLAATFASAGGESSVLAQTRSDVADYARDPAGVRRPPPLPPFALHPLFSAEARARSDSAVAQLSARGQIFFADRTIYAQLPGTVLNAPVLSGPSATGGTVTTIPGGPTSTGSFERGELWPLPLFPVMHSH